MRLCRCVTRCISQFLRSELPVVRKAFRSLSSSAVCRQQQKPAPKSSQSEAAQAPFLPSRSALYINGAAAQHTPFILDPYLDFSDYFAQLPRLRRELSVRKSSLDIGDIHEKHEIWTRLMREHDEVEALRRQSQLGKPPQAEQGTEIFELYLKQQRDIKGRAREILAKIAEIEYDTVLGLLDIPLWLHEETLKHESRTVIYESGKAHPTLDDSAAKKLWSGAVEWTDASPNGYFLVGTTAELELRLISRVRWELEGKQYEALSGPHLIKAVVPEAAGTPFLGVKEAKLKQLFDTTKHGECYVGCGFLMLRLQKFGIPIKFMGSST